MSDRPYSRIYHSIVDDPKFVGIYDDDKLLATWLRLLITAEQAHPGSAALPFGTNKRAVRSLVDVGLLDLGAGSRYRIHGLDAERKRRADAARVGGLASGRSRSVERPLNERSTPVERQKRTESNLDETRQERDEHSREVQRKTNEWDRPRPKPNAVDRDPHLRELRAALEKQEKEN